MTDPTANAPAAPGWDPPLSGTRVVELSTGIAGGYATKLFADAGATVVKVEPPGGDPLRSWSATGGVVEGDGPLFRHLAAGKQSVVGVPGDAEVDAFLAAADVIVESGDHDPDALAAAHPRAVVVSITPFGRTGPYAGRPATEFTVQAECGSIAGRGVPERPPVQAGGRVAEWAAGLYAGATALAALRGARRTGEGRVLDVSWHEAMTLSTNLFADPMWSLTAALVGIDPPEPARTVETPSIYPSADGWIGFNTNGPQHAEAFLHLIERPELIDEGYVNARARSADRLRFDEWVRDWTTRHTSAEILERAAALRVPTARVNDARSVLEEEQLVARDFFAPDATGTARGPRPHYLLDGVRPPSGRPAPGLDQHDPFASVAAAPGDEAPPRPDVAGARPLAGLKVLDITFWWAGPANTQILAAMGADVVHVESTAHPDPMRYAAAVMFLDQPQWWELSSFYLCINTNKRGVTLDLGSPEGVALCERLVEWADVVVENYTPRVMPKFGLGWERIHELNPRAIMVRQPAFGLDGPWSDRLGFAQNMEQMAGMAYLTGYADDEPLVPRGPCDPLGGAHAAFATLAALERRDRTGQGLLVEVPLIEGALNLTAEPVVEHTAFGTIMEREGNRSAHAAPQGLYPCAGEEQWLAVSVGTDGQWTALCEVLGADDLAADAELDDRAGRRRHHDRLDEAIATWAASRDLDDAVDALVAAGVPAARLADPRTIHTHPQHRARGFCEDVDHPVVDSLPLFSLPLRMSGVERWIERPSPTLGQHNAEVLGGLLGLDDGELERLAEAGVIGDRPAGT